MFPELGASVAREARWRTDFESASKVLGEPLVLRDER